MSEEARTLGGGNPRKPRNAYPAWYAFVYPTLVQVGLDHGYAMALHGSLGRDLDVVAVPWIEEASDPDILVEAIIERVGGFRDEDLNRTPAVRPHGRLGWSLIMGGGAYIDLSVMPRVQKTITTPDLTGFRATT